MSNEFDTIYQAIRALDLNAVESFLATREDFPVDGFWTPLHEASKLGDCKMVQAILSYIETSKYCSFNINTEFEIDSNDDDMRGTALSEALLNNSDEVVKLLIENGADVNSTFYSQNRDSCEWAFGDYSAATDQGVCWWLAGNDILGLMVSHDLDVEAEDYNGKTALEYAIEDTNLKRAETLLKLGANPNQEIMLSSELGTVSLLIYTVAESIPDITRLLLKYGALIGKLYSYDESEEMNITGKCSVLDFALHAEDEEFDKIFGLQNIRKKLK
jgi:ankyrin repeat protein